MTDDTQLDAQADRQLQQDAGTQAAQTAVQATHRQLQERKQNPEFLDRLADLGLDTREYPWLSDRLGPLQADAHLVGNRSEEYETEIKWLDQNRAERVIAEREPGRLCRGRVLAVAQGVHRREDKEVTDPMTMDERRATRNAMEAVTNFKALSIDSAGLDALTTATTVTKRETREDEDSASRRLSGFLGGRS